MVKEELKLLVVGIGSIGRRHSDVLYTLGCRNITIWDPIPERAKEHAAKYPGMKTVDTFEEGLDQQPDAVFLCSPPALHMPQAEKAILAGCHVMVEKPLALNLESLEKVRKLAEEKGKMVSVALCNRYHKGLQRVKEIADSGKLGKVINIRSAMGEFFPESRPDYLQTYYVQYSGCFELIHAVDYTLWVAGGEPQQIYGIYGSDADIGFKSPDNVEVLFRTDKGVTCAVNLAFYQRPSHSEIMVYGTEGTCELRYTHNDYMLRLYTRESGCWQEETVDGLYRNMMFEAEDAEFLQSVASGSHQGCAMADAARAVKIYCKVYGDENPPPEGWR
jgi:predicted dehydrogenase